jgi:magnesium chelatase family protein
MHIEVPAVPYQELAASADGTTSAVMREQVNRARAIQKERFGTTMRTNGRMSPRQLRKFCTPDAPGRALLQAAMDNLGLSARAHDRILRMARTIADLAASDAVKEDHISEAINYRTLDRKLWVK